MSRWRSKSAVGVSEGGSCCQVAGVPAGPWSRAPRDTSHRHRIPPTILATGRQLHVLSGARRLGCVRVGGSGGRGGHGEVRPAPHGDDRWSGGGDAWMQRGGNPNCSLPAGACSPRRWRGAAASKGSGRAVDEPAAGERYRGAQHAGENDVITCRWRGVDGVRVGVYGRRGGAAGRVELQRLQVPHEAVQDGCEDARPRDDEDEAHEQRAAAEKQQRQRGVERHPPRGDPRADCPHALRRWIVVFHGVVGPQCHADG